MNDEEEEETMERENATPHSMADSFYPNDLPSDDEEDIGATGSSDEPQGLPYPNLGIGPSSGAPVAASQSVNAEATEPKETRRDNRHLGPRHGSSMTGNPIAQPSDDMPDSGVASGGNVEPWPTPAIQDEDTVFTAAPVYRQSMWPSTGSHNDMPDSGVASGGNVEPWSTPAIQGEGSEGRVPMQTGRFTTSTTGTCSRTHQAYMCHGCSHAGTMVGFTLRPCGHQVCKQCMETSPKCPLCKRPIDDVWSFDAAAAAGRDV